MAIYEGPGQLSGRIGNIIFRKGENGKTIVYQYTPPKEKKKNPHFAVASSASKLLRDSLGEYYDFFGAQAASSNLTGAFRKVMSKKGGANKNNILSLENARRELVGFQFCAIKRKSPILAKMKFSGNTIAVNYPKQDLSHPFAHMPAYITHIQPILMAVPVPDWKYDGKAKVYVPINKEHIPQVFLPKECPVWPRELTILPQSISIQLPYDKWPDGYGLVVCMGFLAVMENQGEFYHCYNHASIEIIEVIY